MENVGSYTNICKKAGRAKAVFSAVHENMREKREKSDSHSCPTFQILWRKERKGKIKIHVILLCEFIITAKKEEVNKMGESFTKCSQGGLFSGFMFTKRSKMEG